MKSGTNRARRGFTLVELLVVIGIIALLISILLPALNKARESANAVKCSANLRAVGQGMADFTARNRGMYPATYRYNTPNGEPSTNIRDEYGSNTYAYTHWSYYVYGENKSPAGAFICPSLSNEGGLPAFYPKQGDEIGGQSVDFTKVDKQVRRIAYVPNEAVMPRNKFHDGVGDSGGGGADVRAVSQLVKSSQVKSPSSVILMTEYNDNWELHTRSDLLTNSSDGKVRSHRPVHAYRGRSASELDLNKVALAGRTGGAADFETVLPRELLPQVRPGEAINSLLDLVGRNHGRGKTARTNFLYCDGHVETKPLAETIGDKWEWGDKIWSLPGSSIFRQPVN